MNKLIFYFLSCCLIISSCKKKEDPEAPDPNAVETVYLSGWSNGETFRERATLWTNGVPSYYTNGGHTSLIMSFVFNDTDIYACGGEYDDANRHYKGMIWKNKNVITANTGERSIVHRSIAVSGANVYTAGETFIFNTNKRAALFSKNGTIHYLTDTMKMAGSTALALKGDDVYVAGWTTNASGTYVAALWINGVQQYLFSGAGASYANAMAISGNDVYITGSEKNSNGAYVAKLWKNGTITDLSSGNTEAIVYSIFVTKSNTVYVSGYEKNAAGINVAKLWKNGVATDLSDGTRNATTVCVYVSKHNNVYTCVLERNANDVGEYLIYKNGQLIDKSDGTEETQIMSMLVK